MQFLNRSFISWQIFQPIDFEPFYSFIIGAYNVTAYANGESLTQEVFIGVAEQIELNFLLGDWNGPWEPYVRLSLG